jgi:surface protein
VIELGEHFYNDDLEKFEALNTTCESIYELGDVKVLIILKDGENLTDYLEIENPEDVAYISEDLSERTDLERYYYLGQIFERVYGENSPLFVRYTDNPFKNIRAMVVQNVSNSVCSLNDMFKGLRNLRTISGLDTWDVANINTMDSLFMECWNLKTISGLDSWDVGSVYDMTWAFNECISLKTISDLGNWNVGNVKSMRGMFKYCKGIDDISPIESWNINPDCDTKNMFYETVFENKFKSKKRELKMEENFKGSNIKPRLTCDKCGSANLVFGGGEIICGECKNLVKSHFELKCPDCGGNDIRYTRLHYLKCERCERVILENVYFDNVINWK